MDSTEEVIVEQVGQLGCITLNRPKALNALSLGMIRSITAALLQWQDDAGVHAVALRGMGREAAFGSFCAGGDIRFFHAAALAGDATLEDFFTEEYTLNHLIHRYAKPVLAFLDGVVMGGGMGLAQGATWRLVTERTRMGMPETAIGLFPDVGGGYFLSRCPGHVGEYLAMTGVPFSADDALAWGLADVKLDSASLAGLWQALGALAADDPAHWRGMAQALLDTHAIAAAPAVSTPVELPAMFAAGSALAVVLRLESSLHAWERECAELIRQRSPLMVAVSLEQVRRARHMTLADDLRMERDMVRHCFHARHLRRSGAATETVEGIRALAVDKDHTPRWNPSRLEDVTDAMVAPFFVSPWPVHAHPLRALRDPQECD